MQNYNEKTINKQNTLLRISSNSDITELFGNSIPYPHGHYYSNEVNRIIYYWLLDGFFDTKKGFQYLNDLIARFKISADCNLYNVKRTQTEYKHKPIKLKQFQGLKSLADDRLKKLNVNSYINSDYVYTCIVLQAEKYIKKNGILDYSVLENFALENFIDIAKDKSTLKSKVRNCWNWYFNRNWKLYHTERVKTKTKEEVMATRQEHAKKIHTKLANDTKKKVLNIITGMFKDEYKKKNGEWNISKIAKDSGTTRPTVMKYLPKETLF